MVSRSRRASLDGHPLAGGAVWGCGSWMAVCELRGRSGKIFSRSSLSAVCVAEAVHSANLSSRRRVQRGREVMAAGIWAGSLGQM